MHSLTTRVLLSATLVLVILLGGAGILIDRAFQDSALSAVQDRLRGRVFLLIGAFDFDQISNHEALISLPDPNLTTPGSGHYARVLNAAGGRLWSSRSMLGVNVGMPESAGVGEWRYSTVSDGANEVFSLSYRIIWEGDGAATPLEYSLEAFEHAQTYDAIVREFRHSLWLWFVGLSFLILIVQVVFLRWAMHPLSRVGAEVRSIELGIKDRIDHNYPTELNALTRNLNNLLKHNRDNLRRYRNSLGDLAHSIKTPLAILRNEVGQSEGGGQDTTAVEQIDRIDRTVQYYLQRSATAGHSILAAPVMIEPAVNRIVASLKKVHAAKALSIDVCVEPGLTFSVDEGDLMEIVGNLSDNACKWAESRIEIRVSCIENAGENASLLVAVSDDGPGIPEDQLQQITQRGTRLDESVEGHGIGLSIVREMVESAYRGRLTLTNAGVGLTAEVVLRPA